jgi:hypothetical protein
MKRSLPVEQDDDSPSSAAALAAGGNNSESSSPSTIVSPPPTKMRRQNIVSVLRNLVNSNSGMRMLLSYQCFRERLTTDLPTQKTPMDP